MRTQRTAVRTRPARLPDVPPIMPLMADFNRHEGIPWRPHVCARGLVRLLGKPSLGFVQVATDGRAVVGYAIVTFGFDLEWGGRDAFLTEIYVARRAQRTGVGRALLEAATARAKRRGVRALHLAVRPTNARARRLYARMGFTKVARELWTNASLGAR